MHDPVKYMKINKKLCKIIGNKYERPCKIYGHKQTDHVKSLEIKHERPCKICGNK